MMPEITSVTSEALQATVRRLLPSQQGFGQDLQATNLIMPIIDLTPTAEGSVLPTDLARAVNYGNATAFSVSNATTTILNTTGFYRILTAVNCDSGGAGAQFAQFSLNDGSSDKVIWKLPQFVNTAQNVTLDFTVFLPASHSVIAQTNNSNVHINGAAYSVADVNGNLISPSGFTFE